MIGSSVKWKGQWNGLLGKWTDDSAYPLSPGRIPGLGLWYSASNPAYDAFTYEQALPTLFDSSGNGWNATQGTGTAQARFLTHDGRNYLRLPGITGNYAVTPNTAALNITGDIEFVVRVSQADWDSAPAVLQAFEAKFDGPSGAGRSYIFRKQTAAPRRITIAWQDSGTGTVRESAGDYAAGILSGVVWLRGRLDVNNGAGGYTVTIDYNLSPSDVPPTSWTNLITNSGATVAAIATGTFPLVIGSDSTATRAASGRVFYADVRNGFNTAPVAIFDPSRGNFNSAAIGSATGETWTINRTGLDPAMIVSARAFLPLTDDYYDIAAGAAGVLQNVGGGTMLAARMCNAVSGNMRSLGFSTDTATNERMMIGAETTSLTVLGRRLDADSLVTNTATTQQLAYEMAIQSGRLNYAGALSANFKNGSLVGSESAFQTAGSSSNTASARMRVFSNIANTPASFQSGPVTDLCLYSQALTNAQILALSRYFAGRTGGAITI